MSTVPTGRPADLSQLLTRAERLLSRRLTALLDAEGLSLDAWRVIGLLADGAGHHMTELAEHAFLPPATLTKLVDQLVEDNLVYRRGDEVDRRRVRAHLTPRGRRLQQRIAERVEASTAALAIGDGAREHLRELLTELAGALDDPAGAEPAPRRRRFETV